MKPQISIYSLSVGDGFLRAFDRERGGLVVLPNAIVEVSFSWESGQTHLFSVENGRAWNKTICQIYGPRYCPTLARQFVAEIRSASPRTPSRSTGNDE